MNVTETGVTNAANLALFMVNLSTVLLNELRQTDPACSVLDLQAYYRGRKYGAATIKMLPDRLDVHIVERIYPQVASLGRIHECAPHSNAA